MNALQRINKSLGLVQGFLLGSELKGLGLIRHPKPSIRAMARAVDCHPEILRRRLKALGKKSHEIRSQLASCFVGAGAICALDPTYTKGTEERLLVIAVLDEISGKAVPVWWSYQNWEEMREDPPSSRNLLVEGAVRSLKKILGHAFVVIGDREFGCKRFRIKLKKMGLGYVLRLRKNDAPAFADEQEVLYREQGFREGWRLVARKGKNPVKLYRNRMRIEALFRDFKSLFGMRDLLGRVSDEWVREGLITLMILCWLLIFLISLFALVKGLISNSNHAFRSYKRGEISLINLGLALLDRQLTRLRSPCAMGLLGKALQECNPEVMRCVR